MKEIWKDVVGFEGWYRVSNMGRIARIKPGMGVKSFSGTIGNILSTSKRTYTAKEFYKNNKVTVILLHRVVLEAFVGPCPDGHCGNHKDGDPTHNELENLEWVTYSENTLHAVRVLGTIKPVPPKPTCQIGSKNYGSKLNEEQVLEIRRLRKLGYSLVSLAEMFGTVLSNIAHIVHRRTWTHI